MDYHDKYLKYKNKYLQLKSNMNQKGGCLQARLNLELQKQKQKQKQLIEDEKAARLLAEQPAAAERARIQTSLLKNEMGGVGELTEANINWLKTFKSGDYKENPINASIPGLDGDTHIRSDLQILIQYFPILADWNITIHLFGPAGAPSGAQSGILCPFHFKIMQENGYNVSSGHDLKKDPSAEHVINSVHHKLKIAVSDYICAIFFCPDLSIQIPEMGNVDVYARSIEILNLLYQNPNILK